MAMEVVRAKPTVDVIPARTENATSAKAETGIPTNVESVLPIKAGSVIPAKAGTQRLWRTVDQVAAQVTGFPPSD